ncbi:hypothetical protein CSC33_4957 [Pseudomonas aeruginosa]|nr:hypothetical protein CSC33_4957 [Pseudomonas aeruginosa]
MRFGPSRVVDKPEQGSLDETSVFRTFPFSVPLAPGAPRRRHGLPARRFGPGKSHLHR